MIAALLLALVAGSGWENAREIAIPAATLPAYVRLTLPQAIDGGPDGGYPDVRVVDASDREVPYALDANPSAAVAAPATLVDNGFVPGAYTQAIADLGGSGALHSAIAIETSLPTFFERVEIATSDDRSVWTVLVRNAPIYRVAEAGDGGTTTVSYGPSRARWVRIRILDAAHAFPIAGASVPAVAVAPRLVPLSAMQTVKQTGTNTVVTFDFGTPNTNVDAVAFESSTPAFARTVDLATSDGNEGSDGSDAWNALPSAELARYTGTLDSRSALTVVAGDRHARFLRVTIENRNDPPLASLRLTPLGFTHHLIFRADPGARYRLLWGNPQARAPGYDLASVLAHQAWSVAALATLGATASTSFAPPAAGDATPWIQRAALPLALALLFGVLLVVAFFAMRSKPAA